jgi:DNA-binding response OmpR family regulator
MLKPFSGEELTARVHALLRRLRNTETAAPGATTISDGDVTVDLEHRSATAHGRDLDLTPIEFRLLATLARHAGQVLSPEQLLEQAWDDPTAVGADRVKFAVLRLRRKLEGAGVASHIETVRGFGYRYRSA